jgi:hypothetical protein
MTSSDASIAPDAGRCVAAAMRQSMLALVDKGESYEAHSAFWALHRGR